MKIIMRQEVDVDGNPLPFLFLSEKLGAHLSKQKMAAIWQDTMDLLRQAMESSIPNVTVHMPKLGEIDVKKKQLLKNLDGVVVSMDSYDTTGALPLQVSRHFMPLGKKQCKPPLGRRPGAADLSQQIEQIVNAVKGQPIKLVDDDTFTGGTAAYIISLLKDVGLDVTLFMVGTQAANTNDILDVPLVAIEKDSDVFDIVDPRDLLFGMKDGGLVINKDDELSRAPWIWPWVDLYARCGMPESAQINFSLELAYINMNLFATLETVFETPIFVKDMDQPFQDFVSQHTDLDSAARMKDLCLATKDMIDIRAKKR